MDSKKLLTLSKDQLEQLFASSPAGPIPNGEANGTAIIAPGTPWTPEIAEFINVFAWQGKIFDAKKEALVNRITAFGVDAIIAKVFKGESWVDGKECIVLDYSQTSFVAHWVRDEIRFIGEGLYLGTVFWGKERLIFFALQF
ncbi:hypothetical protein BAUCODRAFT_146453 [Baudoinia panamericana UAMH 10762]|uniref:Uncharacterized protein n=1 Tax=Baudoinia panamericana (strain UAMH 10762) TaxID=717646 RepID=M2NFR2_BAUPA|nr:uncharacterized protein BAUCODRAFT_146453 [Baudoinia panamericana UAMH 10762]EMC97840.1 hypothetical protein BAUCODRAFT_146453 [Baudoinia panamericana UAMH 10762]